MSGSMVVAIVVAVGTRVTCGGVEVVGKEL